VKFKILIIISLFLSFATSADEKIDWNSKSLNWYSYEEGLKEIKATGKKGMLLIYADWCSTCKGYSSFFMTRLLLKNFRTLF